MIMNCAEDFHVTGENEERVGKGLAALANGARKWPVVVKAISQGQGLSSTER